MPPTNSPPATTQTQASSSNPKPPTTPNHHDNPSQPQQTNRPPLYNAEDYASALRALFTHSLALPQQPIITQTSVILEHSTTSPPLIPGQGVIDMNNHGNKRNYPQVPEMGMKKFLNGSELLFKLEADLRSAFPSFINEFVSGESDGVCCILDALRNIHEALDNVTGLREQRKLVLDERSCVQCLNLTLKNLDSIPKLLTYAHGLYPIVHCTVSTNTSTRVLALDILTIVCEQGGQDAYAKVSEAVSTLRLRLGEPIRCKVLVGAISSAAAGVFQASGIRFLRSFVAAAPSPKYRVYLQVELEDAGLNVDVIRKSAELSPARESRLVLQEIEEYERTCIDVDTVVRQNSQLRNSVATLQQEIGTLKDKIKKQDTHAPPPSHHPQPPPQKYRKNKKQPPHGNARALSSTPIQTITTPVDSEEEAEQIHQILEDLHNIVNNEMLNNDNSSLCSEIVPVLQPRDHVPITPRILGNRPTALSEPNLFESEATSTTPDQGRRRPLDSSAEESSDSRTRVRNVVQQLEQSNIQLFNTLPNFNTSGLASKFANFKSTKLLDGAPKPWGEVPHERVKSLENLDNFTLKWKYPLVCNDTPEPPKQPNSLVVLQDYRMNRFSKHKTGNNNASSSTTSSSQQQASGGGGFFGKKKLHAHPQKTFQISLVGKGASAESAKLSNLSYNDLGGASERVTDLPSGMY